MEPPAFNYALITAFLTVGAFHLLPPIVEDLLDIIKRVLVLVAQFVKWFRAWKEDLWSTPNRSA